MELNKQSAFASVIVVCVAILSGCATGDARLYGSWKSDAERSIVWNRRNAVMTEQQAQMLSQMFGHMTVEYGPGGKGSIAMEAYTLNDGASLFAAPAFTNAVQYKITGRAGDVLTIESSDELSGTYRESIHFEGTKAYWLRLNETNALSVREYFKKIK